MTKPNVDGGEGKREMKFLFIESVSPQICSNYHLFRHTILFRPKEDSLEIRQYENSFSVDYSVVVQAIDHINMLRELKRDSAMKVFEHFYEDNFNSPT